MLLFEITRTKARHKRLRDILLPTAAQCLNGISDGRLIVGYPSGFAIYSLMGDQHPMALVQSDHPSISFISHHPLDALRAIEINNQVPNNQQSQKIQYNTTIQTQKTDPIPSAILINRS